MTGFISKASQGSANPISYSKCANPAFFTGQHDRIGLMIMLAVHILFILLCSYVPWLREGFYSSYRILKRENRLERFEKNIPIYIVVGFLLSAVFGGIAVAINVVFGSSGNGANFPKDGSCDSRKKDLSGMFFGSIINQWIVLDIVISAFAQIFFTINHYLDK